MESSRITNVNEIFVNQCSFDDSCWDWQDLEQFWGEEKHRLQILDGAVKQLSSSVEEHLLHDNVLKEPGTRNSFFENDEVENKLIKRQDITDVPSAYETKGFRNQELIVIGTYVQNDIIPGFQYKVRKNLTDEYLFEGSAKYLESIGLGYEKRITFEGQTFNKNENCFWSAGHAHGYGFTLQTIRKDDVYNVFDTKTGEIVGRALINNPSLTDDDVITTTVGELGYVDKEVNVHFSCDVILNDNSNCQTIFVKDIVVQGKAIVVRENLVSKAKVAKICMNEFIIDSCLLVHEDGYYKI